jgi:hypothetical protein
MKINEINGKILFPEESSGKKPSKTSEKKKKTGLKFQAKQLRFTG